MFRALALILLFALPAHAETRLSPETFERLSEGRTLYFTQRGELFGAEEYHENRQVVWRFVGGQCVRGFWWAEEGDRICFNYRGSDLVQCWGFFEDEAGFFARSETAEDSSGDLRVAEATDQPLPCEGPDAGV